MIVDTSALIAILKEEAGWEDLVARMQKASSRKMSAASWLEAAIIIDALKDATTSWRYDAIFAKLEIRIMPVTEQQAQLARKVYKDFGKGSGHAARLTFGDCFSYALAMESGEALLFKGEDFRHTGIQVA